MTFERQKKRLLGWLALLAPLPLPLNEVLEWSFLIAFLLLVVFFLHRVDRRVPTVLPVWMLNLLGLLYFPIFGFEVLRAVRSDFNSFIKALLHLILFLLVVKLFSIRREGDKWHVVLAVFFIFIGVMATSSHLAVVLYLLVFLGVALHLLARFAQLHVLGQQGLNSDGPPLRRPLVVSGLAILLLAVPLFPLMPRLREPLVMGAGGATSAMMRSTGFSDSVNLSLTSTVRQNRSVAMRIEYQRVAPPAEEIRIKGATYDFYRDQQWFRSRRRQNLLNFPGRDIDLLPAGSSRPETEQSVDIFLEPIGSRSLLLPVEALSLELRQLRGVERDSGGALLVPVPSRETLAYRVELAAEPVLTGTFVANDEQLNALDRGGLTLRMEELATQIMGAAEDPAGERARRLEIHLQTNYAYTLDFVGRDGENPLEDFLFEYKSGHCEYFASSMVLMLRGQGVPARLVTGFLGGEYNPVEGYFLVRQLSAHAWVEALVDGSWQIYDPTPFDGRPPIAEQSLVLLVSQLYDALVYRWDRYVLTFGADDQLGFFQRARQSLATWWRQLLAGDQAEAPADSVSSEGTSDGVTGMVGEGRQWPWVAALIGLLAALGFAYRSRLPPRSAALAYDSFRRRLRHAGLEVPDSLPPLAVQRLAASANAEAALPARQLVGLYLREVFAGESLREQDRMTLREALRAIALALSRTQSPAQPGAGKGP